MREATGNNDGAEVERYLMTVGLGKGYAWCAAFVHWALSACGVPNNITAWSPTAHNAKNVVYHRGMLHKDIKAADVFTIYSNGKKRISHTGFVHKYTGNGYYVSVEGNTNSGGSHDGDGVYRRIRSLSNTYSITRWIKEN
ncbi:CHAP domain-containing protein [Methylotenera sp.]|uniref:CHAP domain-containing protein n=1 Tax=Methylotenera sp. TaxID=2051956 RepID=UPI002ED82491